MSDTSATGGGETVPTVAPVTITLVPLRRFSPATDAVAKDWRDDLETKLTWTDVDAPGTHQGQAASFQVRSGELRAFAKPGVPQHVTYHAAHEKIAADLAYELGLPIPPVVLMKRGATFVSLSLMPFEPAHKWQQIETSPVARARLLPHVSTAASAMCPFDTWVDNCDRHNPGNVIVCEENDGTVRVAYIDYSYSCAHQWINQSAWEQERHVRCYPSDVAVNQLTMRATIDRIEALKDDVVRAIVERVPDELLAPEQRSRVISGLLYRKSRIRLYLATPYQLQ